MCNYNVVLCRRNKVSVLNPTVFVFNPPPATCSSRISISIICLQTDVISAIWDPPPQLTRFSTQLVDVVLVPDRRRVGRSTLRSDPHRH